MRKLEIFVNEKLKVNKRSGVPNLISIIESTNREEFTLQLKNLQDYLKNDSGLPIAELEDCTNNLKKVDEKYQNSNDTFLWVYSHIIYYGTWDELYSIFWSRRKTGIKNYAYETEGFNNFCCDNAELQQGGGIFIITENDELMRQIDVLKKKSEKPA